MRRTIRRVAKKAATTFPRSATLVDYLVYRLGHLDSLSRYNEGDADVVSRIRRDGYVVLENYVSREFCEACVEEIEWIFTHKPEHVRRSSDVRVFGAEDLSERIMRFAADRFLNDVSNTYNCAKTVNLFTLANKVESRQGSLGSGEGWHKDSSFRQFKAILYLNDVDETCGPFQLIHQSHTVAEYLRLRSSGLPFGHLRLTNEQVQRVLDGQTDRLRTITGKLGTLVLVDTASIHRGAPPRGGVRYALTNYYYERHQITPSVIEAFAPVGAEKRLKLRDSWTA